MYKPSTSPTGSKSRYLSAWPRPPGDEFTVQENDGLKGALIVRCSDNKNSLLCGRSLCDFALCVKGKADTLDIRHKNPRVLSQVSWKKKKIEKSFPKCCFLIFQLPI